MSLYKYYDPDSFDYIFTPKGISARFTQPEILNDVFDSNLAVRSFDETGKQESIKQLSRVYPDDPTGLNNILDLVSDKFSDVEKNSKSLQKNINGKYGVLSLSRNEGSRTMWAYYSKDYHGFMIAFKNSNLGLEDIIFRKDKIEYDTERMEYVYTNHSSITDVLFWKDKEWMHEEETRIVAELNKLEAEKTDPQGYPIYSAIIKPEHVSHIILGYRCNEVLKRKINFWVKKYGSPDIKILQTKLSLEEFKLIYE